MPGSSTSASGARSSASSPSTTPATTTARSGSASGLGLIVVTIVGALAVGVAALGAPFLSDHLGVLDEREMRIVLLSSVAIWVFNSYAYVIGAVGLGLRRMLPPNVAAMSGALLNFAFSIGAVIASSDLVVYAVANAAAALVAIVPAVIALAYLWRRPFLAFPSRALTREVLSFGIKDQVGHLAHLINFQTDKTVIALLVDVRAAAAFEVAGRVVMAVQSIAMLATSAMLPTLTVEIAQRGREVVGGLYAKYTLRSSGLAFPIFAVTAVSAPFLLMAWVGQIPGDGALVVSFLTLAYAVHITTGVSSTIVIGMGDPGMVAANSILMAALNVALTLALAPLFDFWGVVTGTFLALSIGSLVFVARFHRRFGLPWSVYVGAVRGPAALAFGLAIPFGVLDVILGEPGSRVEAAAALVAIAGVYSLVYWAAATRLGYLPSRLAFPLRRRRRAMAPAQS